MQTSSQVDARPSLPAAALFPEVKAPDAAGISFLPRSTASSQSASRRWPFALLLGGAGIVLIFALGVLFKYSFTDQPPAASLKVNSQELPQLESDTVVAATETAPVRFANPFDKAEVFEFPAGTTQGEARDAVAETLKARATERRAAGVVPQTMHRARKGSVDRKAG
jgi:hypothetical protein